MSASAYHGSSRRHMFLALLRYTPDLLDSLSQSMWAVAFAFREARDHGLPGVGQLHGIARLHSKSTVRCQLRQDSHGGAHSFPSAFPAIHVGGLFAAEFDTFGP